MAVDPLYGLIPMCFTKILCLFSRPKHSIAAELWTVRVVWLQLALTMDWISFNFWVELNAEVVVDFINNINTRLMEFLRPTAGGWRIKSANVSFTVLIRKLTIMNEYALAELCSHQEWLFVIHERSPSTVITQLSLFIFFLFDNCFLW